PRWGKPTAIGNDGLPERPQRRNFHRAPLGGLVCRRSQPTSSVQEVCLSIHADARQWRATLSDFRFHEKLLLSCTLAVLSSLTATPIMLFPGPAHLGRDRDTLAG